MTRHVLRIGTAVMTTLLALLLLWQFRLVVVYLLFSLALAAALRPMFRHRAGQRLVIRLTLITLYLAALGTLGFLLFLSVSTAIQEIQQLAKQVSVQDEWQQPAWLQGSALQEVLDSRLPPPSELFAALIGDQGQLVLPAVLGVTKGIFTLISGLFIVLFLSLYWSMDKIRFERLWLSLLPSGKRQQARSIWWTVESDLGAYIRSEAAQSILAGLLLGIGYWLLGSPYPVLLALAGAVALLIPLVGAGLAVVPPLLVGLLTGVPLSLLTALYTIIIMIFLRWWVEPRLSNRRRFNPILTVVILIALADAFGFLGIIVAPPLSAACQILWSYLVSDRAVAGAAAQVSDLKERQARVLAKIRVMDEPPPLVTSSMARLSHLMDQAEPLLQTNLPAERKGTE
jgi:predicted PurR-regulated permease PerM